MGPPGLTEMIIILFIVLIVFGPGKLPQLGRSLGGAISQFKQGIKNDDDDDKE